MLGKLGSQIQQQTHAAPQQVTPAASLVDRIRPQLQRAAEVLRFAAGRASEVRLGQVAGSLTFSTVLSLVPLLAVVLALFTAFPLFADFKVALEKNVLRELLPAQYSTVILRYLNDFAAKAARLTAFGLTFLILTALTMILTVDRVLNDIWRIKKRRPLVQRLLIYWALLTLAPLLIGASLSASSYLLSMSAGWTRQLPQGLRAVLDYLPLLLSGFAYAALYVVVPARRVAWRDALIGGFIASVMGEILREAFSLYIKAGTVASIYGAFAVLPLFLLWVYLSWFSILFGAAIAATVPLLRATRFSDEDRAGNQFLTAVALLRTLLIARLQGPNSGRLTLDELARGVHMFPDDVERLLAELEKLDYVSRLSSDKGSRWLLTCNPEQCTLVPLFERMLVNPANSLLLRSDAALSRWLNRGLNAEWISAPLSTLLLNGPSKGPRVVSQA